MVRVHDVRETVDALRVATIYGAEAIGFDKDIGTLEAGMQADHAMLVEARNRVKAMVDKGMSSEEILAENPLADFDADFNWRFITTARMTETLVQYYSGS